MKTITKLLIILSIIFVFNNFHIKVKAIINIFNMRHNFFYLLGLFFLINACTKNESPVKTSNNSSSKLSFQLLSPSKTKVNFVNKLEESERLNHFFWSSFYNGGGVSIGDINNDNLPDIFLTGNFEPDALFINKGNMEFEDISKTARIEGGKAVSSGVVMEDINKDGWLDIYVCKFGYTENPQDRVNLLYINNQDGTFSEKGRQYGLANTGYSIQAAFIDYDKDGDLDMYLVNQPSGARHTRGKYDMKNHTIEPNTSDRLFQNNGNNTFTDISDKAGVANFADGLGVNICDLNGDNWPDIYVANDYDKPDYMYINNQDGTFTDEAPTRLKHMSQFSMGIDIADINNDGDEDIFVLDMAGANHFRSKTNMPSMRPPAFWKSVADGKHYQYMHNVLQLNNGNGSFSEIGNMANIAKTDWSWSILFGDYDNDGDKDAYVTNGIKKDVRNNDWIESVKRRIDETKGKLNIFEEVKKMESTPMSNYFFENQGDLTFKNTAKERGLGKSGFSNGAAYSDLDGDGDLDLVVNNVDDNVGIYQNNQSGNHFVQFKVKSSRSNRPVLGTKLKLHLADGSIQYQEVRRTKGFISSSDDVVHFGLGQQSNIDSLSITWPNHTISKMYQVKADQKHIIDLDVIKKARLPQQQNISTPLFAKASQSLNIKHAHQENKFDDYAQQVLLPHKQSEHGPSLSIGDVNSDGLEDFYIGGAAGFPGQLNIQTKNGKFKISSNATWAADKAHEDLGSALFDADKDGDLDLYVVSGGYEFKEGSELLQDRIYLNDGKGNFTKNNKMLPSLKTSGKNVIAADIDKDGDQDLFVGGRVTPGQYPTTPLSYLLINEGGSFKDVTATQAPDLARVGMVSEAVFSDYDKDNDLDLIVVGEWMPITVFKNDNGQFSKANQDLNLGDYKGWWFSIKAADLDGDGDDDYVVGNLGKNTKFKASEEKPFRVYAQDFDSNGNYDIVLANYADDKVVPVRGRECSSEQLPFIAEKFPTYAGFANASLEEIIPEEVLNKGVQLEVNTFKSLVLMNEGNSFVKKYLPMRAQVAPINGTIVKDINTDGHPDLIVAGNMYGAEVETTRYDAGIGLCLLGDGSGNFKPLSVSKSGFFAANHAKDLEMIHIGANKTPVVLVANNNGPMEAFRLEKAILAQ